MDKKGFSRNFRYAPLSGNGAFVPSRHSSLPLASTDSYPYDPVGNLGTVTYPNGVTHGYTYDTRNRLTSLGVTGTVNGAAGPIASYGYTLDAAGIALR